MEFMTQTWVKQPVPMIHAQKNAIKGLVNRFSCVLIVYDRSK